MKTLSSVEVQNRFGTVANWVKGGEPITVTQYGAPTLMILPFALAEDALKHYHARKLTQLMEQASPAMADAPELSLEQINELVHALRP